MRWSYSRMFLMYWQKRFIFFVTVEVKVITTNHTTRGKSGNWNLLLSVHNSPAVTIQSE